MSCYVEHPPDIFTSVTRSMHDMMPHAAPCQCALRMRVGHVEPRGGFHPMEEESECLAYSQSVFVQDMWDSFVPLQQPSPSRHWHVHAQF